MFFRKSLSYLIFGLMAGSPSISLMAAEGEVLNSFASPTSFSSGQAWVKEYLYLLDRGGKVVHKIDPSTGLSVFSFPVTHTGDLTSAHNFIWISDPVKDEIVKIDAVDGQILKILPSPGAAPAGLAYDGTYLWSVDWMESTVYKLNPVDGSVISSFASPTTGGRPYGLTWDGATLWMVDWVDDTIYQVNSSDGEVIKSFPAPGPNSQGLAWDGKYLWVSDYDSDTIFKVDSGSEAPGVMGCIEVEGSGLMGEVLLSQDGKEDQPQAFAEGCFVFSEISLGLPIVLNIIEDSSGEDVLAPTIILMGDADITIETGTEFIDPGFMATDNIDGDISDSIIVTGNVDTSIQGDYVLSYDVSDAAGNSAVTESRTVHVVDDVTIIDTVVPVLTLVGPESLDVVLGEEFTDEGATALDDVDGDLSSSVVVTGFVDTQVLGTYIITYNVADAAGNEAQPITRTVNVIEDTTVIDTVAPTISLNGGLLINHEQGELFVDPGSVATDNVDGDISVNVQVSGSVNSHISGNYILTYNVSDSSGNAAVAVTREVHVRDTIAPVISLHGGNPISLTQNTAFTDPGASAHDAIDGDLSESIVASGVVDTSVVGTYTRTYTVADTSGNQSPTISRTIHVTVAADIAPPSITLLGSNPVYVEQGVSFTDPGATASDEKDGNISNKITVSGSVNSNLAGTYILRYNVSDAAGNRAPEVTRSVIVRDTIKPEIVINGASSLTVAQYSTYSDAGATAQDNIDGNISGSINVSNNVNTDVAGTYTVSYNVSDSVGNSASTQTRTVIVEFECRAFTSSNSDHESAGRAYSETTGFWVFTTTTWYATGSGNDLGTSGSTSVTLSESPEGHFSNGSCN